jgi:hypothetical protein
MIIGLVGFAGSGKDTVAQIFVNKYGFIKESFAKPVKDSVSAIFGWDRDLLEGITPGSRSFRETKDEWWSSKLGMTWSPRIAMQTVGTDLFRQGLNHSIWLMSLERRLMSSDQNFILSDLRFVNECQMVHDLGGKLIRVKRGPEPDWFEIARDYYHGCRCGGAPLPVELESVHPSERDWIGVTCDYQISNDGTIDDLEDEAHKIWKRMN